MIRIVIPAYKASETLPSCLNSLLKNFNESENEIVVVDNGGNDNLSNLLKSYPVKIVTADDQPSAAVARNRGASDFEGEILVFLDADVEVEEPTIDNLVTPILDGRTEATVGNFSKNVEGLGFAQKYKQLYINNAYSRRTGYIKNEFWTAIGAIKMSVFSEIEGFSTNFAGACSEDTELGQRLTKNEKRILAVPDATGKHLKKLNIYKLIKNDLVKGTNSFYISFLGRSVTEFRHSTPKDMRAVFFAYASIFFPTLLLLVPPHFIKFSAFLFFLIVIFYLSNRKDLLSIYKGLGKIFLIKAILLMFSLDIVRGLCVFLGIGKIIKSKILKS